MKTRIIISIIGSLFGGLAGHLLTGAMHCISTTETYVRSETKQIAKQSSKDGRYVAYLLTTKQKKIRNTNYQPVVIYRVSDLKNNTSVAMEFFRPKENNDHINLQLTWENDTTVKFVSNTEQVKNITMHFGASRSYGAERGGR